jgi:uncharacterized protein (DUF111 family)
MKTLYLDIFSGISGDMFIAALIDLGVEASQFEQELKKLRLEGYHLHVARGHKASLEGIEFNVHLSGDHDHGEESPTHGHTHSHSHAHPHEHGRTFAQIRQLITESQLSDWVKQKAVAVFQRIAVAEGKIHGLPPEQVGFHEVGAVDSIIDILGACIALEMLGRPRVLASPVVEGTGWIDCALAELVESFGPMQGVVAEKIGYGLGTRDNKTRPNVLRAVLGESRGEGKETGAAPGAHDWETDTIAVLETNLDDLNAEILGSFMEKALAVGALDVFYTAIQMKKSRPGVLLTVLCAEADADRFSEMLVHETSTFGVRRYAAERRKLRREFVTVQTPHGAVTIKVGRLDGRVLQAAPEFESCRKLAEQAKLPLKGIYEAALRALPPSLLT